MWSRALYSKDKTNHFVSVSEVSFNVAIVWRKINDIGREASAENVCHIVHLYFNLTFWIICDSLGCLPPTGYNALFVFSFAPSMFRWLFWICWTFAWIRTFEDIQIRLWNRMNNPILEWQQTREGYKKNYLGFTFA